MDQLRRLREVRFAVFAMKGSQYVRATRWHNSYNEAAQEAEMHTNLGMDGFPVGRMGVMIDERTYLDAQLGVI